MACDPCMRVAWVLSRLGGHIERLPRDRRPRSLLSHEPEKLIELVGGSHAASLRAELARFRPDQAVDRARSEGILVACPHGGDFTVPRRLREDPEAPCALHLRGDPFLLGRKCVAIVGARKADAHGRDVARQLAGEAAAADVVVVSGLALGVDGAAHRGALDVIGGQSIAVVGGGISRVYPPSHRSLHEELAQRGAVFSEVLPGAGVWRWSFPARNRLIAALCELVVVVQAASGSGSLHTAEAAIARGVPVAAVPGEISNPLSDGTNMLIADGAQIICRPEDVLLLLGARRSAVVTDLEPEESAVLERIEAGLAPAPDDADSAAAARIGAVISRLELRGLIRRCESGGWLASAGGQQL